jgi:hypothetical protein
LPDHRCSLRSPSIMVRRQGRKRMRAILDSSNGEKKNEGEGSSAGLDAHVTHAPTHRREEGQRFNTSRPGSPFFSSLV